MKNRNIHKLLSFFLSTLCCFMLGILPSYSNTTNDSITKENNQQACKYSNDTLREKLESTLFKLYKLGYRQMPQKMQELLLAKVQNDNTSQLNSISAFSQIDNSIQYLTLSENTFPEIIPSTNFISIGNTTIDIQAHTICNINTNNNTNITDPITFAMSIDPLAAKFPNKSPYNAMGNNPINRIDPTGMADEATYSQTAIISPAAKEDRALWIASYTNVESWFAKGFFSEGTYSKSIAALDKQRKEENLPLYNSIILRGHGASGGITSIDETIFTAEVNREDFNALKANKAALNGGIAWVRSEKEGGSIEILWDPDAEWVKSFQLLSENTTLGAVIQFAECHTGQGDNGQAFLLAMSMITNRTVEAPTGWQIGGWIPGISGDKIVVKPGSNGSTDITRVNGSLPVNGLTAPGGLIDKTLGPDGKLMQGMQYIHSEK